MRRWFAVFVWAVTVMSGLGFVQRGQAAAETVSGNAALVYWQAFDGLPDLMADKYKKGIATPLDQPLDDEIVQLFEDRRHVLMLLHRGTRRTHCDWGIEVAEDGPEAILPHLALARDLARLAVLRARHRFHEGRQTEGVSDVLGTMTLGRYAGRDRTLVGILIDNAIQHMAQDVVAAYLPRLSKSALDKLATGFARLPAQNSFAQCMVSEGVFAPWLIQRIKATKTDAEVLAVCRSLVGDEDEKAEQFIEKSGGRDGIIRYTTALKPLYDTLPGLVNRPYDQDSTPFQTLVRDAMENPVGELLFPALDKAWHAHRRYQCRNAMLRAAVDIAQRGKTALVQHHDPTDGNNFEYAEFDGGFELRSKLKESAVAENVVRLVVGKMP